MGVLSLWSTTAGVIYYVEPTEPCAHNSSCPSNEISHTIDHYASNSSHYFSPDHINITLYFMCGLHNSTKNLDISDLNLFAMIGTAERQYVTINMPIPTETTFIAQDTGRQLHHHFYTFTNVCDVIIKNVSINYISVNFEGKNFSATNAIFYGFANLTSSYISVINVTGSSALFENCTFQENSFLRYQSNAQITIHDSIFHSYNHVVHSPIFGLNSTLNISGVVFFIKNTVGSQKSGYPACGAVIYLAYSTEWDLDTYHMPRSILNINSEASVHFINNTADCGGALYLRNTAINIGNKANLNFCGNTARNKRQLQLPYFYFIGGAAVLTNSSLNTGANVKLLFYNNFASHGGGAVFVGVGSKITLSSNTVAIFASNIVVESGGAIELYRSKININGDSVVYIYNNTAMEGDGGALHAYFGQLFLKKSVLFIRNNSALNHVGGGISMYNGKLVVSEYSKVIFSDNQAHLQGGAIYESFTAYISIYSYSVIRFINNSASQGGALYLPASARVEIGQKTILLFANNSVSDRGGAVYANVQYDLPCFLVLLNYSGAVIFKQNAAKSGIGMDIYGASIKSSECSASPLVMNTLSYCSQKANISFIPSNLNNSYSLVSSNPKRVCLCDSYGHPQCATLSKIFVDGLRVYSGEAFNLSLVVVGHDFGVTTGSITANFMSTYQYSRPKMDQNQYYQWLKTTQCSNVTYSIITMNTRETIYIQTTRIVVSKYGNKVAINRSIAKYNSQHGCLDLSLLTTPVYINVSILPACPQGFRFDKHTRCTCFQILKINQFKCYIMHNTGYLEWNSTVWVNAKNNTILVSQHCPFDHCLSGRKVVNLAKNSNAQCNFNHAGTLCGGCKDHYSIAIGSSRCIQCSSNSHISLVLFFTAAGIILVFFILALNLTVTQGLINGVILYANILWTYKDVLFPSEQTPLIAVFQIFIAWLNLDFGIEICLAVGLTAFWKTWLQFLFPLYIWLIAGVIIIACHYSSRLTSLIGDRAVPLLATLFLLSYTKLLRTLKSIFEFGVLTHYPNQSKSIVWYIDGNLSYGQHPHIYLFVVAITTLIFCLCFTLFLLLIQCWRRISHLRLLRWMNRFTPFYDAYFAPLKDKHHYWFGTLLLVRIVLLISFTATSSTSPFTGLLFLQFTLAILFFYLSIQHVYKSKMVRTLESISILNLIILVGFTLHTGGEQAILFLEISIVFSFIHFTAIVVLSFFKIFYKMSHKCVRRNGYHLIHQDIDSSDEMVHERVEDPVNKMYIITVDTY